MNVEVLKTRNDARLPEYMSDGAAGADLFACLPMPVEIEPCATVRIPTGLAMAIPCGYAGLIFARSGLAVHSGLAPANKVGVIDSDYRGEISVSLYNQSPNVQTVNPGDRIAQIVFIECTKAHFILSPALSETERGTGGFGSTGR